MGKRDSYILPSLKDAGRRSKNPTPIIRDEIYIPEELKDFGKNKKYFIRTYGCQANERDSETIKGILIAMGFKEISDWKKANLVILNTCAIRQNAEDKVFGRIGELLHVKKANPNAIILAEHYEDALEWLMGDEWDTIMNYQAFMEPLTYFLIWWVSIS